MRGGGLFLAGVPAPGDTQPPARNSPLYVYLYERQAASVGPAGVMGLRFVEWMRLPDDGEDGTRARTLAELPAIRAALSRGEPVILGLVLLRSSDHVGPWNNHQVLAYAMARGAGEAEEMRIYDPNLPRRDDVVIRITDEGGLPRLARVAPGRREMAIRGMFRMAYVAREPAIFAR